MDTWDNHCASGYAGGTGTASNPYRIETAEQLAYMSKQSKTNTFSGVYFSLTKNIDLSVYLWTTISQFGGTFDGGMNTITGLTALGHGLFNYIGGGAIIKNTILDSIIIMYNGDVSGAFTDNAGNSATISNCIVSNFHALTTRINNSLAGGFVGQMNGLELENCLIVDSSFNCYGDPFVADSEGDEKNTIKNCAAIRVSMLSSTLFFLTHQCNSSYVDITSLNGTEIVNQKVMRGASSDFGDWVYSPNLNGGYPIQKSLLTIAPAITQTSSQVYNYLISLGFTA